VLRNECVVILQGVWMDGYDLHWVELVNFEKYPKSLC